MCIANGEETETEADRIRHEQESFHIHVHCTWCTSACVRTYAVYLVTYDILHILCLDLIYSDIDLKQTVNQSIPE